MTVRWSVRPVLLVVCLGVALGVTAGTVAALDAQGSPDIELFVPDGELTPGTETELTVQFANDGVLRSGDAADRDVVTTARGVTASIDDSGTPVTVNTKQKSIGQVTESDPKDVVFDVVVPDDASPGTYELTVSYSYSYTSKAVANVPNQRNIYERATSSKEETIKIEISDDAEFEVTELDSALRVGEEGRITGRLNNIGASVARNAEVEFTPSNENINALSSTVAVGDIPADESARFSIPVEITSDAEAVPHRFELSVNYRDKNGISQTNNDPEFLADIGSNRDEFLVEPVNNTITAGGTRALNIRVTNNLDETVTEIEGKFFADDPLDSTNDETFTDSLAPGETTTVTVDLSAASGATIKNYPTSIDFRYVDSEGDSKLTDSYRMAISVAEPQTTDGPPVVPIVGSLLVVAGGGYLIWRRGVFSRLTG